MAVYVRYLHGLRDLESGRDVDVLVCPVVVDHGRTSRAQAVVTEGLDKRRAVRPKGGGGNRRYLQNAQQAKGKTRPYVALTTYGAVCAATNIFPAKRNDRRPRNSSSMIATARTRHCWQTTNHNHTAGGGLSEALLTSGLRVNKKKKTPEACFAPRVSDVLL